MRIEIELPETMDVASRGQAVTFDLTSVNEEKATAFFAHAALHGLKQAIADSAASALAQSKEEGEKRTVEEIAVDLMKSKCAALASGEWTQRRERQGANPVEKRMLQILRKAIGGTAEYKAMTKEEREELLARGLSKHEAKLRETAERELEAEEKMRSEFAL